MGRRSESGAGAVRIRGPFEMKAQQRGEHPRGGGHKSPASFLLGLRCGLTGAAVRKEEPGVRDRSNRLGALLHERGRKGWTDTQDWR